MSNDEYLRSVIQKYKQSATYTYNENQAYNFLKQLLENNFKAIIGADFFSNVQLHVQQSGSRAKGTAIKGSSDIDMFLSIYDPSNFKTLEQYFDLIHGFINRRYSKVRKQNVSIGLEYSGFDVDIVPAKRVNAQSYQRQDDHYLWSTKKKARTLTNIQKHINIVQFSNAKEEIILTKVWRKKFNIDFPSIYLELLVIDALSNKAYSLEQNFNFVLRYIRDNIENKRVIDPGNSNNVISDTLSISEKLTVKRQAQKAIDAQRWSEVVW